MRRNAGKEGEYQQESFAKIMKRKTKGTFFYTWIGKVVLKKGEYEWDGLYIYSSKKTRGKFYFPSFGFPLQEHLRAEKIQNQSWQRKRS